MKIKGIVRQKKSDKAKRAMRGGNSNFVKLLQAEKIKRGKEAKKVLAQLA